MGDACCDDDPSPTDPVPVDRHPLAAGEGRRLLTPDDVHHQWFATVRLREGYDMGAVDTFLREVEYTIDQLFKQTSSLREQLAARPAQPAGPSSDSAAMIITHAERTAHEALTDARAERERMVKQARAEAERITRDAQLQAERIEHGALSRSQELHQHMSERHADLQELNRSRMALAQQLADLRRLVDEYRSQLTGSLENRLDDIERRADEYLDQEAAPQPWSKRRPLETPGRDGTQVPTQQQRAG
ncbi:DivIVA family protein [Streptomyces zinciresistens K42]|uniref:Cell wall synthesis protein Wag31 n=1 Tax=Streptomyces zinciresistens K42 TaxID=700597 RepID=G2GBT1_9ACTN|nr:DivIVA domain-containing protein [Streptomyces zinciresistens]EGX59035.1 DivIVA family protein [Streptomyces zinciresistens K42]